MRYYYGFNQFKTWPQYLVPLQSPFKFYKAGGSGHPFDDNWFYHQSKAVGKRNSISKNGKSKLSQELQVRSSYTALKVVAYNLQQQPIADFYGQM